MPHSGLWPRVVVGLLFAVLPPLLLLVTALVLTDSFREDADPNLVAICLIIGSIAWVAVLAIIYARSLGEEFRLLLTLAKRGDDAAQMEMGTAYQQMASALEERNRQLKALAMEAARVPIDDDPQRVVRSLVTAVRSVMGDPTWRCAVLSSDNDALLPPGVYHAAGSERSTERIGDLEQWAAVAEPKTPARHIEGPWGAFVVVDVAVSDRMHAVLYAPWEGRVAPTRSEIDLLALVGQHSGTALEHSLLYATVQSQADELTRLAAVQADFLRGVTHDLQTPLTSIGALATELGADARLLPAARIDLDMIVHQADRLRRLVSQLLVASRLEAGVLVARQDVFAVPPLIERTWAALRADRPFEVTVTGPPHLAVGDPDRLEQVLWAVFDNAVKYSPANSPVDVRVAAAAGTLAISVRDRGLGMGEETHRQAFMQFFRDPQARRLAPNGSGVGLYAARGLMKAMDGSIDITSRVGFGCTVTMKVPAEPSHGND